MIQRKAIGLLTRGLLVQKSDNVSGRSAPEQNPIIGKITGLALSCSGLFRHVGELTDTDCVMAGKGSVTKGGVNTIWAGTEGKVDPEIKDVMGCDRE